MDRIMEYRKTVPTEELELFDDLFADKMIDLIETNTMWETFTERIKTHLGNENVEITRFRLTIPEENWDEFNSLSIDEKMYASSFIKWSIYERQCQQKNIDNT